MLPQPRRTVHGSDSTPRAWSSPRAPQAYEGNLALAEEPTWDEELPDEIHEVGDPEPDPEEDIRAMWASGDAKALREVAVVDGDGNGPSVPWGNIRSESGTSINRHIFTGKQHDPNTGLVYFGARYYDPEIGRFLTQDTYLGEPNTPPSLHRYLYAYSNPTVFIDPNGNSVEDLNKREWPASQRPSVDPGSEEAKEEESHVSKSVEDLQETHVTEEQQDGSAEEKTETLIAGKRRGPGSRWRRGYMPEVPEPTRRIIENLRRRRSKLEDELGTWGHGQELLPEHMTFPQAERYQRRLEREVNRLEREKYEREKTRDPRRKKRGPFDPEFKPVEIRPPQERRSQLRDPKTGRFISDPNNPPSPYRQLTDAQRRAEWKRLARDPESPLTEQQRQQIRDRGWRGPQRVNPETGEIETMELSHEPIPRREGGTEVVPRWPEEHEEIDPYRHLKKR